MIASEYGFNGTQIDRYVSCGCFVTAESHKYNPGVKSGLKVVTVNGQTAGMVISPWGNVWASGTDRNAVRQVLLAQYRLRNSLIPKSTTR